MDYGRSLEKFMMMEDATWKRHANPCSVWTRFMILPLFVLAIWSRAWIGWWCCVPIGLLLVWTFLNPRVFSKSTIYRQLGIKGDIWRARLAQAKIHSHTYASCTNYARIERSNGACCDPIGIWNYHI